MKKMILSLIILLSICGSVYSYFIDYGSDELSKQVYAYLDEKRKGKPERIVMKVEGNLNYFERVLNRVSDWCYGKEYTLDNSAYDEFKDYEFDTETYIIVLTRRDLIKKPADGSFSDF